MAHGVCPLPPEVRGMNATRRASVLGTLLVAAVTAAPAGAPWRPGSGAVAALTLDAPDYLFVKPGETRPITVTARFADGSSEIVTPFCDFRTQDDAVAEVNSLGRVKAVRPGDTGLVVV